MKFWKNIWHHEWEKECPTGLMRPFSSWQIFMFLQTNQGTKPKRPRAQDHGSFFLKKMTIPPSFSYTSSYCHNTVWCWPACWNWGEGPWALATHIKVCPACCCLMWESMSAGDPHKSHKGGSVFFKKAIMWPPWVPIPAMEKSLYKKGTNNRQDNKRMNR